MTPDPLHYVPGSGWAVTASSLVVLCGSDVPESLLTAVWAAASGNDGPQEVLDALLGAGLRSVPSFGLAHRAGDGFHVLVRGGVEAVVDEQGTATWSLTAQGALTWVEQAVPAATAVTLRCGAPEEGEGPWLPLAAGIVQAVAIAIGPDAPRSGGAPHPVGDAASPSAISRPAGEPVSGRGPPVRSGSGPAPAAPPAPIASLVAEVTSAEASGPAADDGPDDEVVDSGAPAGAPDVGVQARAQADGDSVDAPVGDGAPPRGDQADAFETLVEPPDGSDGVPISELSSVALPDAAGPGPVDELDDYGDLFGTTRAPLPVEHAAVRPEAETTAARPEDGAEPVMPPHASPAGPSAGPSVAASDLPRPEPVVTTPPPPSGGLIDVVPLAGARAPTGTPAGALGGSPTGGAPTPARAPSDDVADDDALATVSRARLRAARSVPSLSEAVAGPPVHGLWCTNGHANPPAATRCRQCQAVIEQVDPVTMPRPVLGALEFSNGMRVVLDRPAVIGRSPRSERVSASEIPQLVVVPSPEADISRSHLEVRLEGWHVLVVDLDSTNGTVVTIPGQEPQRLRPKEEVPISPGTVVSLADEVTFTYAVGS